MRKKAFIGPLGDDIPSIFPIVFAVLIFTGTIIYANQLISGKAKQLEIREGLNAVSYLVTEKGFIDNKTLLQTCGGKINPRAASLSIKYLVTLKRFCDGIPVDYESLDLNLNPYSPETQKTSAFYVGNSSATGETWAYCSNAPEVEKFLQEHSSGGLIGQPAGSVLASFPIAVPCPEAESFTSGLGVVNVITWK